METTELTLHKGEWLIDVLKNAGMDRIPTNVILEKTLTGIGATHTEIHTKRNSIIIEPNVPVIKGKVESNSSYFGVYGRFSEKKFTDYLQDESVLYKKILVTPESFYKIKQAVEKIHIDIHNTYFCLFDECEKIGQGIDFRKNITFPIPDFFKFKEKAFVSATPLQQVHDEFDRQNFKRLIIKPDYDYRVKLDLIITDTIRKTINEKIASLEERGSQCICIFFNSPGGIKDLVSQFNLTTDSYMIFCAEDSANKLKIDNLQVNSNFDPLFIKKINFFTSRFYSGVDFNLPDCPDVIIVTDLETGKYTKVDPLSESIQIQGRFRNLHKGKHYSSLTHITTLMRLDFLTNEQVREELETWYKTATNIKQRYDESTSSTEKKALIKEFKNSKIYPYLDTPDLEHAFKRNTFSIINKYNEERVTSYYTDGVKLKQAYEKAGYFDVSYTDLIKRVYSLNLEKDLVKPFCRKRTTQKEKIQSVITQLESGIPAATILTFFKDPSIATQFDEVSTIIEAVQLLGIEEVRTKSTIKAIKKYLELAKRFKASEEKRFSKEVILKFKEEFDHLLNTHIHREIIKQKIEKIYANYGFIKENGNPFRITNDTIREYYTCKVNNEKKTCMLISLLQDMDAKIQSE